jgi:hypothetical protein
MKSLLLIAVGILFFSAQPAKAQEILKEYLFEGDLHSLANWGAGFKGDYKSALSWKVPFHVSLNAESHSGGGSLRIEIQPDSAGLVRVYSPGITIPPSSEGITIQMRAFIRTEGLTPGSVGLGILEKTSEGKALGYIGGKERAFTIDDNIADWQEITLQGKLHSETGNAIFMMTIDPQSSPALILLDDLVVEIFP